MFDLIFPIFLLLFFNILKLYLLLIPTILVYFVSPVNHIQAFLQSIFPCARGLYPMKSENLEAFEKYAPQQQSSSSAFLKIYFIFASK